MGYLSKEDILNADDLDLEEVDIPEWGGKVHIGLLTIDQLNTFIENNCDKDGKITEPKNIDTILPLLEASLKTPEGEPLFTTKEIMQLRNKSARPLKRLFYRCLDKNTEGLKDEKKS